MTKFFAQPYIIEHTGFCFDRVETLERGMKRLKERGCEEVEIQLIDGEDHLARLANNANISLTDIYLWFEELDDLDETAAAQNGLLLDLGYALDEVLERYGDVCLFEGSASDYACELINDVSEVPEHLRHYIDYDAIARDTMINGEISEIERELILTNAQEF